MNKIWLLTTENEIQLQLLCRYLQLTHKPCGQSILSFFSFMLMFLFLYSVKDLEKGGVSQKST